MKTEGEDAKDGGSGGTSPADTLISDFHLQNCEKIHVCRLSHPVCCFVMVDQGD